MMGIALYKRLNPSTCFKLIFLLVIVLSTATLTTWAQSTNRQIAFVGEHQGGLYLLNYSTLQLQKVNVGLPEVGDLDYSPEQKRLAFEGSGGHHQNGSLYLLNLNDLKKERIFSGDSVKKPLYRPKFDPLGQHLYAVNYFEGIKKYSLSKKTWEPILVRGIPSINPQGLAFSKSGQRVAISPGDLRGLLIATVKESTFYVEEHILADLSCTPPQWINEQTLIFAGRKAPGLQYLWKFDLQSKNLTQLTTSPMGTRDHLSLSRDGKTIVFTGTDENFEWRIWEIMTDGTQLRKLTKGGNLTSHLSPVWIE